MDQKYYLGQLAIYRSELFGLLSLLSPDTLDQKRDVISGTISDIKSLWGSDLSPLQTGMIEALEVIEFRIRNREKFSHGADTGRDHPYFICRKCETSILIYDFATTTCPSCDTAEGLELVYV